MNIRVGFEITLSFPHPTAVLLTLRLHPSRAGSLVAPEQFEVHPHVPVSSYVDSFGNHCDRLFVASHHLTIRNNATVRDSGLPDPQIWNAPQHNVQDLPDSVLIYLFASRYCEVDSELKDLAGKLFNATTPGWPRVQAICNFVNQHLRFDYLQARANRTALEAFRERTGVCRDYAHLAITLCRCMNIPCAIARVISATSVSLRPQTPWISVRGLKCIWVEHGTHSTRGTTFPASVAF